jgi:energy-converting hydrogenase A subunit M
MARTAGIELLEQKIEKAQMDVVKTKQKYDATVAKLGDLMDKKDALKRDELVTMIMKSKKSYEEILRFFNDEGSQEE